MVMPTQPGIARGVPIQAVFSQMQRVFSAESSDAKDLNEVTCVGMQQMKVSPQLLHYTLRYRTRTANRATQLILKKDQRARRCFRPIMQPHVGEHSIKHPGHLCSAIGRNRMLLSCLINPVRMVQDGFDQLSGQPVERLQLWVKRTEPR